MELRKIAKKVLDEVESLSTKAQADIHYCRGCADGVNRMVEDIEAALAPKFAPKSEAEPQVVQVIGKKRAKVKRN